jgi:hypothetical protein
MVGRSSLAVLSPAELTALRRIGRGFARHVPEHHQDTLVALGLVVSTWAAAWCLPLKDNSGSERRTQRPRPPATPNQGLSSLGALPVRHTPPLPPRLRMAAP